MLEQMLRRQWRLGLLAGLVLLVPIVAVVNTPVAPFAVFLTVALVIFTHYNWRKWYEWLEPLKSLGEPLTVLRSVDADIAARQDTQWLGTVRGLALRWLSPFAILTPGWLVRVGIAGIAAAPAGDILWVFFRRCVSFSKKRPYDALGLRVYCRDDSWVRIPLNDPAELDAAIEELLRRRPEIAVGYRDELLADLAAGPTRFAQRIEQERAEWPSLPAAERQARHADKLLRLHDEEQSLRRYDDDPFRVEVWVPRPPFGVGRGWSIFAALKLRPQLSDTLWADARRPFVWAAIAFPIVGIIVPLIAYRGIVNKLGFDPFGRDEPWVKLGVVGFCGVALGFLALRGWWRGLRGQFRRRFREFGDPTLVAAVIDDELRGDNVWVIGSPFYASVFLPPNYVALTRSWLLQALPGRGVLIHLGELVWVYKRRDPGPAWLPWAERRFELGCRTRDGRSYYILAEKEEGIDRLFEELLERRPALLVGWGGECLDLLEQGPAALARAYDGRAAEFEKVAPEQREVWLEPSYARFESAVLTKE